MVWHNTLQLLLLKRWYDIHKHTMPGLARSKVVWCILHNKSGFSTAKKNIKEIDLIISAFFRKPPKSFVGLSLYASRKEISAVSYKAHMEIRLRQCLREKETSQQYLWQCFLLRNGPFWKFYPKDISMGIWCKGVKNRVSISLCSLSLSLILPGIPGHRKKYM